MTARPQPQEPSRPDDRAFWDYVARPERREVAPAARASRGAPSSPEVSGSPSEAPAALSPISLPVPPGAVLNTVLFDLETRRSAAEVGGWGKAYRMLVAVGVVLHLEEGRFEIFREDRVPELIASLEGADLVIGFNVKRFDYSVLNGYTGIDYNRKLPTLDLLEEIHRRLGFRVGLSHLAKETLGDDKSADGLQSLQWVREGRLDLVEDYCRKDVEILRDLYLFGRRMGYLVYRNRDGHQLKLQVDW
jgi:DEAD/DEAH box helicase domain-containing protein